MRKTIAAIAFVLLCAATPLRVPDVTLTDQQGRPFALQPALADGVVAINFVFTSCTTICQPMGATFARVQQLDPSARLVSITLDPSFDTPERLAQWGAKFGVGKRWTLLTGSHEDVERVLKSFGVWNPNRFAHAPVTLVVDSAHGRWTRVNGIGNAKEIAAAIRAMRAEKEPAR